MCPNKKEDDIWQNVFYLLGGFLSVINNTNKNMKNIIQKIRFDVGLKMLKPYFLKSKPYVYIQEQKYTISVK